MMYQTLVFQKDNINIDQLITDFALYHVLTNDRTAIYENNGMRVSIDRTVIRVMIFDCSDYELIRRVKDYFYDDINIISH